MIFLFLGMLKHLSDEIFVKFSRNFPVSRLTSLQWLQLACGRSEHARWHGERLVECIWRRTR